MARNRENIRILKNVLYVFSVVLALTGVGTVMLGGSLFSDFQTYQMFVDLKFQALPVILLVLGFLIVISAVTGFVGCSKENYPILTWYSIFLSAAIIIGVALAYMSFSFKFDFGKSEKKHMIETLGHFTDGKQDQKNWNILQTSLQCCGIDSPYDWFPYLKYNSLPHSCCTFLGSLTPTQTCDYSTDPGVVYQTGCRLKLENHVWTNLNFIFGLAFGLTLLEFVGMSLAYSLAFAIWKRDCNIDIPIYTRSNVSPTLIKYGAQSI